MLLQWTQHPAALSTRLTDLLEKGRLLDVKLAGEGGFVRAHRVVLAAASAYFDDLLADCTDHLPTIFFRDVALLDLEKIVQYIYTGDCQVAGTSLQSFLCLARTLGLPEFVEQNEHKTTPSKRKLDRGDGGGKENRRPGKSASEPATLESTLDSPALPPGTSSGTPGSATKKRRLITQSLDNLPPSSSSYIQPLIDSNHQQHPQPAPSNQHHPTNSCPAQPLYANLATSNMSTSTLLTYPSPTVSTHHFPPLRELSTHKFGANNQQNLPLNEIPPQKLGANPPIQEPLYSNLPPSPRPPPPLYENLASQKSKSKSKVSLFPSEPVFKVPLPPGPLQDPRPPDSPLKARQSSGCPSPRHFPTSSCPAPPSPALPLSSTAPHHAPNFSFDSHFLDPEELAAKGATLLHHLAVWMIQQRREEGGATIPATSLVGDELPPPEDTSTPPLTANKGGNSPRSWDGSQGLNLSKGRSPRSWDGGNLSTPPPKSSSLPRPPTGMRDIGKSESDRPDSGFDSKDGEEEDVSREETKEEGSPEVGEISRQAVARQPVKKKKMFSMSAIQ